MTVRVALTGDESSKPASLPPKWWLFLFYVQVLLLARYGRCWGRNQYLSLLALTSFSPLCLCLFVFFSISPFSSLFSFFRVWARLSATLSVFSPPLALSSLTLSGTYLRITNDNGLCALMWEFCNQLPCMAYALMALIFSDLNAPQDHQRREDGACKQTLLIMKEWLILSATHGNHMVDVLPHTKPLLAATMLWWFYIVNYKILKIKMSSTI